MVCRSWSLLIHPRSVLFLATATLSSPSSPWQKCLNLTGKGIRVYDE